MSFNRPDSLITRAWEQFELLRFATIGCLSAGVYALMVLILCGIFGWKETVGGAVAYLVAIPVNFWGQKRATFRSQRPYRKEILPYLAVHGMNLVISSYLLSFVSRLTGSTVLAIVAVAGMVVLSTYIMSRIIFLGFYKP